MECCLVTGCAGFIGSTLTDRLLADGFKVIGIDSMDNYYSVRLKEKNLASALNHPHFHFINANLLTFPLENVLKQTAYIFHQAGQPGVRGSWGKNFNDYLSNNVLATQKLLETAKNLPVKKFIYASSSSVYGETKTLPMKESDYLQPVSPYGVTKLAGEHLCLLYYKNFNLPVTALRYFVVYGPRQRPDMAFHLFIKSALAGKEITVLGNGEQSRDYTHVSDTIEANILAMKNNTEGQIINIGSGNRITLKKSLAILEEIISCKLKIIYHNSAQGDVFHTLADITKAEKLLGFRPKIKLEEGLTTEFNWLKGETHD